MKNIILLSISFVLVFVVFLQAPAMYDYNKYINASRNFMDNPQSLYTDKSPEFYYMPWSLIVLVPFSILPDKIGQALFMSLTLVFVLYIAYQQKASRLSLLLTGTNVFVLSVIASTQWDIFILLALFMAVQSLEKKHKIQFSIWMMIAITKPTNIIIPVLWMLWHYRKSITPQVIIIPALISLLSFAVLGVGWISKYIQFVLYSSPPEYRNMSIIKMPYAIPIITVSAIMFYIIFRKELNPKIMLFASIVLNLIVSPYIQPYHLSACFPALIEIEKKSWALTLIPSAISIIVLYQAVTQNAIVLSTLSPVLLVSYPIAILFMILISITKKPRFHVASIEARAEVESA